MSLAPLASLKLAKLAKLPNAARAPVASTLACALILGLTSACAGTASFDNSSATGAAALAAQVSTSQAIQGVRIGFHFADYYTLTAPNAEGCAGDAREYFDPVALFIPNATVPSYGYTSVSGIAGLATATGIAGITGPMLLPPDVTNSDQTIKPGFIKNVSVDLTDANANVTSNLASACSLGNAAGTPPTSNCATFDYGAIGGIPTSMGGTMLMIGGVQNYNYAGILPASLSTTFPFRGLSLSCGAEAGPPVSGVTTAEAYTQCYSGVYALGVDTLPANAFDPNNPSLMPSYQGTQGPTGPVSTWANLSGAPAYSGPLGGAGASAVFDMGLQQVLLFGGAAPLAGFSSSAPGITTYDTWILDLKSQAWTKEVQNVYVSNLISNLYDMTFDFTGPASSASGSGQPSTAIAPVSGQVPKASGARALFGYVAMPGMGVAVNGLNATTYGVNPTDGTMDPTMIDPTDRLMIIGGLSVTGNSTTPGVSMGTHRFNPTYGPEVQNVIASVTPPINISNSGITQISAATAGVPVQWVDSYHTQLMDNSYGGNFVATGAAVPSSATTFIPYTLYSSHFTLDLPPIAVGPTGGQAIVGSAFVPLVNIAGGGGDSGIRGTGYLLGAGGFDYTTLVNSPDLTLGDAASRAVCTAAIPMGAAAGGPVATSTSAYNTNTDLRCGGGMSILSRFYGNTINVENAVIGTHNEGNTSYWSAVTNFLDTHTEPNTPAIWNQIAESSSGASTQIVPLLGGASMLPGFSLATNDVVYFGGTDCIGYVSNTSAVCNASGFGNAGSYRIFGNNPLKVAGTGADQALTPVKFPATTSSIPSDQSGNWGGAGASMANTPAGAATPLYAPQQAGMATARGLDPHGNIIILAWGGAKGAALTEGNNRIYFLTGTSAAPRWGFAAPVLQTVLGTGPTELINSAMVFSHVTKKFYVFGGYDPSSQNTNGSTYELSIASADKATCSPTAGNCIFTWRQLDQSTGTGLTCYPSTCPPARRSHRMAEVNYYNRNPGGRSVASGEQSCDPNAPCSYGIFMEGGSSDGNTYLSDRWMFDPTANGGNGHWQLMNEFPPRRFGAMASVDYAVPTNNQTVHRAVLFGGETGLGNPDWAPSGDFVAPTLGDTWIYDYDAQSWNRVQLQGMGYSGVNNIPGPQGPGNASGTEFAFRQGFDATAASATFSAGSTIIAGVPVGLGKGITELSPPALAGAVMITRTQAPPSSATATTPLHTLPLPEVYMFGGRLKDGSFNPLQNTYKFCLGSTGEAYQFTSTNNFSTPSTTDFTCDAFDATANPGSPSPVASYVGRWITKVPDGVTTTGAGLDTTNIGSYLGAGAYDPTRDKIVLFGGLSSLAPMTNASSVVVPTPGNTAVTDTANLVATADVFEYTPPQAQLADANDFTPASTTPREGRWTYVPACAGYPAPVGRYGHSLAYNTREQNLVLVGGYAADGTPLTQAAEDQSVSHTYTTPEVWTGTYCNDAQCGGLLPVRTPKVNLTNAPCYFWKPVNSFSNSSQIQAQLPPQTGIAHAASVYIPATGFNTGFYSMFDNQCTNAGPITSPDNSINKLLAGGAYIDIDRSQLGATENLLLNITFIPMGPSNVNPDQTALTDNETAVFRVHLIKTGQTAQQLQAALQPRYMGYSDTQQFPETVQSLAVMAPPTGQITQEQVMIPLGTDPNIDRIRIERYSGTGILLDAAVYRMGSK